MKSPFRLLLPLIIFFTVITILIFVFSSRLEQYNVNANVLLMANVLLLLISVLSFYIQRKGLENKNPHAFVRSVTIGMMLKMVICIIALIIYNFSSGKSFNKKAIFIALFLYLIYLSIEVYAVMKMNKNKKANV